MRRTIEFIQSFCAVALLATAAACSQQVVHTDASAGDAGADAAVAETAADSLGAPDQDAPVADIAEVLDAPGDSLPAETAAGDTSDTSDTADTASAPEVTADAADSQALGADDWPAQVFAPYVDASLYPVAKIADIAKATGQKRYTLGFIVAADAKTCKATWGTYYSLEAGPDSWEGGAAYTLYGQIAALRSQGGDIAVSFGGAASVPLHVACPDVAALTAQYQAVVDKLALRRIDFDIEGSWLEDAKATTRNSQAIAALQSAAVAKGKPLGVWLTLPVLPSGLTAQGLAIVDDALAQGVDLAGVNLMAMDYGDGAAPNPKGMMGSYAISAVQATHAQLAALWAKHKLPIAPAALWGKLGCTPMIGLNDVLTELFSLADAKQVASFASAQGLGLLSMWSTNRDHPCPNSSQVQLNCSSDPGQKADFEFTAALQGAFGP